MIGVRLQSRGVRPLHIHLRPSMKLASAAESIYEQLKRVKSSEEMMEEVLDRVRRTTAEEVAHGVAL